jgi:VCBS repeat-containing protein
LIDSQHSGSAVDSIAAGGKSVKNFNITINDGLIKEVQNHFNSSNDNPETAGDFMWQMSNALQMMLNDINYAAG